MKIKFFLTLIMVAVFSNTSYADSTADMAARLACLPASQNISSIFIKYTRGEISKEEAVKKINNEIDFSKNKLSFKGGIGIE